MRAKSEQQHKDLRFQQASGGVQELSIDCNVQGYASEWSTSAL